jgi:hypothetical protein
MATGLVAALGFAITGCDEMQYDNAVEEYNEEVQEGQELTNDAMQDNYIDEDEADDISDQAEEVTEAAGEVAEQKGDLIESKTD